MSGRDLQTSCRRWAAHPRAMLCAVAWLLMLVCGCEQELPVAYGSRTGFDASSVNGTSVFGEMLSKAGHHVTSVTYLSPKVGDRTEAFVWFTDEFTPPSKEAYQWFDAWLRAEPSRVLIYVARDSDAAPLYWQSIKPQAPAAQQSEIESRRGEAEAHFETWRSRMPEKDEGEWFTMLGKHQPVLVRDLKGDAEWTAGIDPSKLQIELHGRLEPATGTMTILSCQQGALITRAVVRDQGWPRRSKSYRYVVTNGSFLLNLPLVNHEHRKLASTLVQQLGSSREVTFLESGSSPRIHQHEPPGERSSLAIFGVEPFDHVLLHLAMLGVMFCFSRWVIFGRPRPADSAHVGDFGQHVAALGKLLQRSRGNDQAIAKLNQFVDRQTIGHQTDGPQSSPI